MEEFYDRNILLTEKKVENITTREELQVLDPGAFGYGWLEDGNG